MENIKRIALIAHDNRKKDLLEWAQYNKDKLCAHKLLATGTTGHLLEEILGIEVIKFHSGPLGGDQEIGSEIVKGNIDFVFFLWDPLSAHPHDPDVKALLRLAVVWNIPIACNRSTADFIISSPLMYEEYHRQMPNFDMEQRSSQMKAVLQNE